MTSTLKPSRLFALCSNPSSLTPSVAWMVRAVALIRAIRAPSTLAALPVGAANP